MEKRYKALRFISIIFKVLGGLVAIITILGALSLCATGAAVGGATSSMLENYSRDFGSGQAGEDMGGILSFGGALLGLLLSTLPIIMGGFIALLSFAAGESLDVLLALEENTRTTTWLLQNLPESLPSTTSASSQQLSN